MIYLASPYSGTPDEQHNRFLSVEQYVAENALIKGVPVFSPILYCHAMTGSYPNLGTSAAFWLEFNTYWVRKSTEVHVLKLNGWDLSVGVLGEIALAEVLNIPITQIPGAPYENY